MFDTNTSTHNELWLNDQIARLRANQETTA